MVAELAAVLGSIKTAADMVKGLLDVRDAAMVREKVIALQSIILDAQNSAIAANERETKLLDSIRSLEQEVARLKAWDAEKAGYRLHDVGVGGFAYVSQVDANAATPQHWLCVKCFDRGEKSLLQVQGKSPDKRSNYYECQTCHSKIVVPWSRNPTNYPPVSSDT
ncbi:MAG: hypothetical protein WBG88_02620 [Mesorhizobium sp.]